MSIFRRLFINSSLVPLAKIANAKDRPVRIVWAIFTATMCVGLLICISFVVRQYMQHQTAFQLDSSSEDYVYDQLPGVTICLSLPTASDIKGKLDIKSNNPSHILTFAEKIDVLKKLWIKKSNNTWDYRSKAYFLPAGKQNWNSEVDAKSLAYSSFYNFNIKFNLGENKDKDRIFVIEQIPNEMMLFCTTFEFRPIDSSHSWSSLKFTIEQSNNQPIKLETNMIFTMILHERGELPFSAYDRFIYSEIRPQRAYSVYMSKSVMKMLNTKKNPCHEGQDAKSLYKTMNVTQINEKGDKFPTDMLDRKRLESMRIPNPSIELSHGSDRTYSDDSMNLFGTNFLYSRESCGWSNCCQKMLKFCSAHCSTEMFGLDIKKKNLQCQDSQCQSTPISYDVCPGTCVTARYSRQNFIESLYTGNSSDRVSAVNIYKTNNVEIAVEEEIFTLAKLFSEIGGLCSLFIGFSSTFIFELLEGLLYLKPTKKLLRLNSETFNANNEQEISDENELNTFQAENTKVESIHLTEMDKKIIPLVISMPNLDELNSSENSIKTFPVLNNIDETFRKDELLNLLRNGQVKFQIKFSSQTSDQTQL